MLLARASELALPVLEKRTRGGVFSDKNAFSRAETLHLTLRVPRAMGVTGVLLRLCADGGADTDRPFCFRSCDKGWDRYCLTLALSEISPETGGLFFYELILLRGGSALFSDSEDNVTFTLSGCAGRRFRLLVCEEGFTTPLAMRGRVMYHVFVDRFAPCGGERRADAVYHAQWAEEIVQFGAYPGAPVANDEFFAGTLWGILHKLDYLQSLGVGILYLSPIFKAHSNHKYDTGDYECVDAQFGGEAALLALLAACRARGIAVILDGVFNHTGDDSKYFNRYGRYPTLGAYQSTSSPYFDWYYWRAHPDAYLCWWDIPILPKLRLENPAVHRYFLSSDGVIARYMRLGVSGWRLDVADELPNAFLEDLRVLVKRETDGDGVIFGEVWENAADKIAYGERRRYFLGRQLDGVMNYPLREGIVRFVRDGDAPALCRILRELWASYPTCVCHTLMNILSTHDTERILTVLGGERAEGHSNAELRDLRLTSEQKSVARNRLYIAAALQYTLFGIPSLYYGDEAGLEGYADPFCRRPYPWGREDAALLTFYKKLGTIRRENPVLQSGSFRIVFEAPHALAFSRKDEKGELWVVANRGEIPVMLCLPRRATELLSSTRAAGGVCVMGNTVQIWRLDDVQARMGKVDEK